jgi:hypothetical protein
VDENLQSIIDLLGQEPPIAGPDSALALTTATTATGSSSSDGIVIKRLRSMVKQAQNACNRWHKRSKECWEFYDNEQWTSADKEALRQRRQAPITINRIAPTIDLVVGLQVTQPVEWNARPVGLQDDSVAQAMSAAMKFVSIQNNSFDTLIDAYRDSLVYGIGWMLTGFYIRDPDPRSEPVQITRVDPREIMFDPKCKNKDLSDAKYIIWSRKIELDDALRAFPKLKSKYSQRGLERYYSDETGNDYKVYDGMIDVIPPPSMWDQLSDWNMYEQDDHDPETETIIIRELWERTTRDAMLMEHRNGYIHEFDPNDENAMTMLMSDDVRRVFKTTIPYIRYHVFSGTTLLVSEDSPYKHNRFPFVPVWHKRDRNGDPFSMVETLKDMQREINHRRSRLLWELISNSLRISPKAFAATQLTMDEVQMKAARPDSIWVGDRDDIDVMPKPATASSQFQLMQDAKQEIQSVSGMNDDLMGFDSSSRSGKSKQISMIQGATIQRPKEANLHLAHKICGELVMQLIQQAHTDEWVVRITDNMNQEQVIQLNTPMVDPETGQMRVLNDITQARFDVQIEEAPWTPTQRDRAMALLSDMIQSEPDPIMRNALHEAAIMVGDIPYKAKVMEIVKNAQNAQMQQAQAMQQMQAGAQGGPPSGPEMGPAGVMPPTGNPVDAALNPSAATMETLTNPGTAGLPLPNIGGM